MSALVDVSATMDNYGRATVKAGSGSGVTLVSGNQVSTVSYARNAEGAVAFAVKTPGGETSILNPGGGALGGVIDGAQRLADARTSLGEMATAFVEGVNQTQAEGRDLNGNPGAPIFAVGAAPTDISMVATDPRTIAAAGVGEGTRGNANLARLESLRTSAGYEASLTGLVSANASAITARNTVAAAQSAIHDGAITARDAVSGVDLDSEAVDLLRFQQAYQASSRVISIARDTFQSILDIR